MENTAEMRNLTIQAWLELMDRVMNDRSVPEMLIPSLLTVIFVASLVGNSATCIVICCDKTMHTLTNYYLLNLAVSDLLVTLAIPLVVHEQFRSDNLIMQLSHGELACKIHYFLIMVIWNNCILTMTTLAVERYMAICHPMVLQSMPVRRRVMKVIGVIWIVAILETIPDTLEVYLLKTELTAMCITIPTLSARIVNGVLAAVTFLIPLGIMMFVYSMIAFRINVREKNALNRRTFNKRNNRTRINKLILALTVAFVICWVPFFIIRICIATWKLERLMQVDGWWIYIWEVCSFSSWFSTVLNPLLFSVMSSKFRHSLKTLWNRKIRRQQAENANLHLRTTITCLQRNNTS